MINRISDTSKTPRGKITLRKMFKRAKRYRDKFLTALLPGFIFIIFTDCVPEIKLVSVELPDKAPVILTPYARLDFAPINESSGLVKSRLQDDVYWTHNDSGDEARIFAVRKDGSIIKPEGIAKYTGIRIKNAENEDWEDIAIDNKGNLIIGECGNNSNKRQDLCVYFVKEPSPHEKVKADVFKKISFFYPDQDGFPPEKKNFDSEAIFQANEKVYVLTKHRGDEYTKLYRLDSVEPDKPNPLTPVGYFDIKGRVTAADASPDGKQLAVLTYNAVWLFEVTGESDNYFSGKISWLPIEARQCEGICFDGDYLLISNEQRDLFELPLDSLIVVKDNKGKFSAREH